MWLRVASALLSVCHDVVLCLRVLVSLDIGSVLRSALPFSIQTFCVAVTCLHNVSAQRDLAAKCRIMRKGGLARGGRSFFQGRKHRVLRDLHVK